MLRSFTARLACALLVLPVIPPSLAQSRTARIAPAALPSNEVLSYFVEWRLIYAGNARLSIEPKGPVEKGGRAVKVHLESAGLVSKLYKLDDNYEVELEDQLCSVRSYLNAIEKSRHRETKVEYDHVRGKATYVERDLVKNSVVKTAEADIPACVSDIIGGIYKLRTMHLEPGQSTQLALSDGQKSASVRVEAQAREQIKTKAGTFSTIRYEAFVFNGVLYSRKAQLLVWLTDDGRRIPVQIRARMVFPIGSITLELAKEEHW
jgi:hypothetical protein